MSKHKNASTDGRRNREDQERDKSVYRYILTCLTDLGIPESDRARKPNEYSIARQWGQHRVFIRRVLRSVLTEHYEESDWVKTVPGLTLGKLVEILGSIEDYWLEKREKTPDIQNEPHILTRDKKLTVLRKFSQLSLQEQEKLNLLTRSGELLLQQLLETITDPITGLQSQELKIAFYKNALNLYENIKTHEIVNVNAEKSDENTTKLIKDVDENNKKLIKLIKDNVEQIIKKYYREIKENSQNNKVEYFLDKILAEINKIEFQAGTRQIKEILQERVKGSLNQPPCIFLNFLTRSVIENTILNNDFPVYFKEFEVEKVPILPLYLENKDINGMRDNLLNPIFLDREQDKTQYLKVFEKQIVYKVKVYFSVRLPDNYPYRFGERDSKTISRFNNNCLEFVEEITGIGSPITHIIAAINKVVLGDIPELRNKDYLPIAREIFNKDEVIGENSHSPVLSYTVISLCKRTDVHKAIEQNKEYDEVTTNQELVHGQYCGFDLVEASAQAGLFARLRAIKQAGIEPKKYLTQLCHSLEEKNALRKAESYLDFYPFSSKAMQGFLEKNIFKDKYRTWRKEDFTFDEIKPLQSWSMVAYEAHLKIAQAYLQEGRYRLAKKYLDVIQPHIEKEYLNHLLLARYHLCQFRYRYLADLEDREYYSYRDRAAAVREAEESLNSAQDYLEKCLQKYHKIGEPSQSNFHPFFYLFSRIFAHRTKLYIFNHLYATSPSGKWSSLQEAIRLLEQARIYAARDGSSTYYSYWSAYQSWCYLMKAYLEPDPELTRKKCMDWAERLIEHAKICYSYTGKICYQQIKDNGGKTTPYSIDKAQTNNPKQRRYCDRYGDIYIQVIPLIQEFLQEGDKNKKEWSYDSEKHILNLDTSELKVIDSDDRKSIYLFGTYASLLIFSMGMFKLCDDKDEEKLKENIETAMQMFNYCSAIAEDGTTYYDYHNNNNAYLDRFTDDDTQKSGYALIKGLYPHRLTQFTDLGKIFATTCSLILYLHGKNEQIDNSKNCQERINNLIKSLEITQIKNQKRVLNQRRYNGHLETHIQEAIQYFQEIMDAQINGSLSKIRDRIVIDIFKIVRGVTGIRPYVDGASDKGGVRN